ncbi:MAG: glycosyltransferase [Pseudolabrys sp.]|nr:glycosyltransferase [Pseudolabrys sp.]
MVDPFTLVPEQGIEVRQGRMTAVATPAWLAVNPVAPFTTRTWVRVRYRSSFFDDPVRPLLRFTTRSGEVFHDAMTGAFAGGGEWIGRVPPNTMAVSVSPVTRTGRFDFTLESVEPVSPSRLFWRGLFQAWKWTAGAVIARLLNARLEARQALRFAGTATPLSDYHRWLRSRSRDFDPTGIDAPRFDWATGPTIRLLSALGAAEERDIRALVISLQQQAYARWVLYLVRPRDGGVPAFVTELVENEPRCRTVADVADIVPDIAAGDWLSFPPHFARFPDHALACLMEHAARHPDARLIYGDEDAVDERGRLHAPILKPDWSPLFEQAVGYLGDAVFLKAPEEGADGLLSALWQNPRGESGRIAMALPPGAVSHLRRPLLRGLSPADAPAAYSAVRPPEPLADPSSWPRVLIVVPTRDRCSLLSRCVQGLREKTDYPDFHCVIVDNDSREPDALALLESLQVDARFTVLRRPGPFNFSALSNDGARSQPSDVIVFLNNDVEMLSADWLRALVKPTLRPQTGMVGALLEFPNGKIQHAGVVLGLGGDAGHIYHSEPVATRGYLGQLTGEREVGAVTAACIAIERKKFEAVGGFDDVNLPVELNDIDLCLRLSERGFVHVLTPRARLIHHESASRGFKTNGYTVYARERAYFDARWAQVIRDDPYFHPALSLYFLRPALG